MSDHDHPRLRARVSSHTPPGTFTHGERDQWAQRFGVAPDQIDHDHIISHLLTAISLHADRFVFYGGTALSRAFLPDLRLSEDIDLLSIGPRRDLAALLDQSIYDYIEPRFGQVTADPWLAEAKKDTQACVFHVGDIDIQIQLIDGRDYTQWPTQNSLIEPRYTDIPEIRMCTYTATAFVGAKTSAWTETTRNAPRDLYDLWALAQHGYITPDAAQEFKKYGPTGGYPEPWLFPTHPPTEEAWLDALRHQCIPQVSATQAYDTVIHAWSLAVAESTGI